ncbi:MAG: acyl-ACP--UDP-N-acetylglucosamine O-acyltransferase, partial [Caldimonas sp.]
MATVHATAIVEPGADLAANVEIGPYSIVRAQVRIGAGSVVGPHCVIEGHTTIGSGNRISQFNAIGGFPQDKKYGGEPTRLVIGDGNTIREFCTIHVGTVQDAGVTRIGDDNWIMNNVHIAHDCAVGSHTIIAGYSGLAGHVRLGDWAIVGGQSGLLQFVRVGAHAMIGFQSHVAQDVPPFMMVDGHPLAVRGFNAEGLRRRGFS